jgi:hypothetical protein
VVIRTKGSLEGIGSHPLSFRFGVPHGLGLGPSKNGGYGVLASDEAEGRHGSHNRSRSQDNVLGFGPEDVDHNPGFFHKGVVLAIGGPIVGCLEGPPVFLEERRIESSVFSLFQNPFPRFGVVVHGEAGEVEKQM